MERVILHSDMNGFYASVSLLEYPEYRQRPLAVGGNPEKRHGIILAKNELAKKKGVKTGEALWEAKSKCPGLIVLPPNYPKYTEYSKKAREIYYNYTPRVEPFGLDEAWLDVTGSHRIFGDGMTIAQEIRQRIKRELKLTVSIGVSYNKIFSKFGSDYKKPDAITCITRDNYKKLVWESPVEDLLFVGRASAKKLRSVGIDTIGRLAITSKSFLKRRLGKLGEAMWYNANGEDYSPVKYFNPDKNGVDREIKSIGNGMTAPRDLKNDEDVKLVFTLLAESVGARLREQNLCCSVVSVSLRSNDLVKINRQMTVLRPTNITTELVEYAMILFKRNYDWHKPIRSVELRADKLISENIPFQLSFFVDEKKRQKQKNLDTVVDGLRKRYGNTSVLRGIVLTDSVMGGMDIKGVRENQLILPTN